MKKTNNKNINYFLDYVQQDTKENGVKLYLPNHTYLWADGVKVNGYFSEEDMVLATAMKKKRKRWLETLVHEYSHFDQWREQSNIWLNSGYKGEDAEDIVYRWVLGEEFPQKFLKKCFELTKKLELDCERRSVKKIKKFNLPLNPKEYAQQASAYIHYYNYMELRRDNYVPGREPYYNKKIVSVMPTNLRGKYSEIPKDALPLFDKLLLK